ncbi:crAss001_48 related protein [Gilliamella apicola]|uniref:crAss001_48 related protein n=1 Tax=Gilliamella apicola TaxID=1196095 RepID=UPI002FEE605B
MQLQPYQQRVIAESDELADKLAKLTKFINSERFTEIVPDELECERLFLQKSIMTTYLNVLNYRIDAFK